jgi:hypothetical protein
MPKRFKNIIKNWKNMNGQATWTSPRVFTWLYILQLYIRLAGLSTHPKTLLLKFKKLVYFHGRPNLFKIQKEFQPVSMLPWNWSIFTGACPFWNSKGGLFSRAIYPFQIPNRTSASVHASLKLVLSHPNIATTDWKLILIGKEQMSDILFFEGECLVQGVTT